MSPFETVVAGFAARVARLEQQAQVALFAAAADVLRPRYVDWVDAADGAVEDQSDLLDRAVVAALRFAAGDGDAPTTALLGQLEAATPSEPFDVPWATAAQDCWICADTAVRSSLGDHAAQESTWYLLEPMFQSTSERLFGVVDVGSERQDELEGQALEDPALSAAVSALDDTIEALGAGGDRPVGDRLAEDLAPIRP